MKKHQTIYTFLWRTLLYFVIFLALLYFFSYLGQGQGGFIYNEFCRLRKAFFQLKRLIQVKKYVDKGVLTQDS